MTTPPYSLEIHGTAGHAIVPGSYATPETAIGVAKASPLDAQSYYAVSDKDQVLVWVEVDKWVQINKAVTNG